MWWYLHRRQCRNCTMCSLFRASPKPAQHLPGEELRCQVPRQQRNENTSAPCWVERPHKHTSTSTSKQTSQANKQTIKNTTHKHTRGEQASKQANKQATAKAGTLTPRTRTRVCPGHRRPETADHRMPGTATAASTAAGARAGEGEREGEEQGRGRARARVSVSVSAVRTVPGLTLLLVAARAKSVIQKPYVKATVKATTTYIYIYIYICIYS